MADTHSHQSHPVPAAPHLDPDDISMGTVTRFIVYLTVLTVVVHGFIWWFMVSGDARILAEQEVMYPLAAEQGERLPPAPRLQTLPREELSTLRDGWRRSLEGYSWLDKGAGAVRVPIEQAMQRVLTQGIPTRAPGAAAAPPAAPPAESAEKK